jgi:hypothetical protein
MGCCPNGERLCERELQVCWACLRRQLVGLTLIDIRKLLDESEGELLLEWFLDCPHHAGRITRSARAPRKVVVGSHGQQG